MYWRSTWIICSILTMSGIGSAELYLRSNGHCPSVTDDLDLWANERNAVYRKDGKTVVLLGASRIQLGFSTETFRARYPDYSVTQLAVDGSPPLATLADLAADQSFFGIIICSVTVPGMASTGFAAQQDWVNHYHHRVSLDGNFNRQIATLVQANLAIANPRFRLANLAKDLLASHTLPGPSYVITHPDRSRSANYDLRSKKRLQEGFGSNLKKEGSLSIKNRDGWLRDAKRLELLVSKIQSRGGKVVFLRMPTSGAHWENSQRSFPKQHYWDAFASITSAQTIHFFDIENLRGFECPDRSHLDQRDKPAFTNALLDELIKQSVLPGPKP